MKLARIVVWVVQSARLSDRWLCDCASNDARSGQPPLLLRGHPRRERFRRMVAARSHWQLPVLMRLQQTLLAFVRRQPALVLAASLLQALSWVALKALPWRFQL